jgi:hypothetical protein
MVHWTSQTMPRHGDPKPYDQAVTDFNVDAFADQMNLESAVVMRMGGASGSGGG